MKKFINNIILFLLFPIIILIIAVCLPPFQGERDTFLYSKIEKDTLLKNTNEPRIIFIGGSNLALGLNSQSLKDSLNIHPINTGLDCNIGISYMINNTIPYIKKNDIVVLCLEYEQFYDRNMYGGYPNPIIEFSISKGNLNKLSYNQAINLIKETPAYCFSKFKIWNYFKNSYKNNSMNYKRNSFNIYGDHITHWQLKSLNPLATKSIGKDFNLDILNKLIYFTNFLKSKNSKLFISFPPFQKSSFILNENKIKYINNQITKLDLSIISNYEDYIMPDSLMFDSPYHLIKNGVDMRTNSLISDLKKILKK